MASNVLLTARMDVLICVQHVVILLTQVIVVAQVLVRFRVANLVNVLVDQQLAP